MKIIHFNDYEHLAGAESAIRSLRKEQEELGHETYLFTQKDVISFYRYEKLRIIKCRKIIKRIKPDIIHLHNVLGMGLAPLLAAKKEKIPVIWTIHDYWLKCPTTLLFKKNNVCNDFKCHECSKNEKVVSFDYKNLYQLLNDPKIKIIVASRHMQEFFQKNINENLKFEYIYWDVDKSLLKREYQEGDPNKILFGGRKDPEKGLTYAIQAIARIKEKNPLIKLVFAGSTRNPLVNRLAKIYNVENNIIETGLLKQEKFFDLIQECGSVLCASVWGEPFNLNLLEGMALGKPVIATKVGGQQEVVGDAGIVIEPKSSLEITEAIEILNDKEKRKEIGKKCRERAKSFTGCTIKYLKLYEEMF